MGQNIRLKASDGHEFDAYVAEPAGAPRGALVVVQEIFGVNSHIRNVADGYAGDGYWTIAPALFDRIEPGLELGYSGPDMQRGMALKAQAGNDKPLLDIAAALARTTGARPGLKAGIVGYCWGGLLTWLSACELDGLSAAVPYYGGGMPDHAALQPRCPVLAHFGERDAFIPLAKVEAFRKAQPGVQVEIYAADHGFNCDQRGSHDAPSAKLARERTLQFLRRHVG